MIALGVILLFPIPNDVLRLSQYLSVSSDCISIFNIGQQCILNRRIQVPLLMLKISELMLLGPTLASAWAVICLLVAMLEGFGTMT